MPLASKNSASRSVSKSAQWPLFVAAWWLWAAAASVVAGAAPVGSKEPAESRRQQPGGPWNPDHRPRGRVSGLPRGGVSSRLDRELSAQAVAALADNEGIEGGYFVQRFKNFLGTAALTGKTTKTVIETAGGHTWSRRRHGMKRACRSREADLIDIQVDAAIRKKQVLFSIEELRGASPVTVAIRTAPSWSTGGAVGATWVMTRLVDPLFVDRSLQGYRLAAGLALGGIALAFGLTAGPGPDRPPPGGRADRLQTELRRSERLAALGKLLAGVAHEVRNPLAGIRSTAQLWQRGIIGLDDESLGGLVHEVDRLEEIVSRLLQFSRADAQDLAPGDLNAVLAEAGRLAVGPAEAEGNPVEVDLDPDLPPVAMAPRPCSRSSAT